MTFRSFRDKAAWAALAGGLTVVAAQWWAHSHYVDRVHWIDRTPGSVNALGFLLTLLTLLLGSITFPRWQSLVALLAVAWVLFIWVQGI
jgi:hypothetical protein